MAAITTTRWRKFVQARRFNEVSYGSRLFLETFQFIGKNWDAEISRLHTLGNTDFEYFHDFLHRRAELQGRLDVPACAGRVHMGDRRIDGDAQELRQLGREYPADVNREARGDDRFRPRWVQLKERVPGRIPLTGVAAASFGSGFTPAAFASSSRMGAPRLHVWIDRRDAILRIIRISSRVAPASSAPRMWRRVPPALRFVQAAFTAMLISSMSLRGSMLLVHGLSDILRHWSTQMGSHSRSLASARLSHGPVEGTSTDRLVTDAASALSGIAILLSPFTPAYPCCIPDRAPAGCIRGWI